VSIRLEEVAVDDPRARAMRELLDEDLHARYAPLNAGESDERRTKRRAALHTPDDQVAATWVALDAGGEPLGHVMLRRLGPEWELKRLVVAPHARRRGVGRALTQAVVERARSEGARRVILQTGDPQPESIAMYRSTGFTPIPVYEPYAETMPNSRCFELVLEGASESAGRMAP
jgi:GNAT superfamily N-acetyltransferase